MKGMVDQAEASVVKTGICIKVSDRRVAQASVPAGAGIAGTEAGATRPDSFLRACLAGAAGPNSLFWRDGR